MEWKFIGDKRKFGFVLHIRKKKTPFLANELAIRFIIANCFNFLLLLFRYSII